MSSTSAPEPPDPIVTAAAQTDSNVQTAIANATLGNVNEVTPNGTVTFSQSPSGLTLEGNDVPTITRTVTLSPEQQALQDQTDAAELNLGRLANQQTSQLFDLLGQPVDTSNATARPDATQLATPQLQNFNSDAGLQNFSQAAQLGGNIPNAVGLNGQIADAGNINTQIQGAGQGITNSIAGAGDVERLGAVDFGDQRDLVTNSILDRARDEQDRDLQGLQTRLAQQGIEVGSQRYQDELEQYQTGINDFRLGAILAGGEEQSRLADLDNTRNQVNNAAQQQLFNQNAQQADFSNAAQNQLFNQNAQNAAFGNSAQQQQFNQNAQQVEFGNNTSLNEFNANLARSQSLDQAAQQNIINDRSAIDQGNVVNQQTLDNFNQGVSQNNNTAQQAFSNEVTRNNAINNQRNQELDEVFNTRNQAINENIGLLSGAQVNNPNFAAANQPTIPTTDTAGIIQQDFNNQLGIFQQEQAQNNSLLGGVLGLGSSLIGLSDRDAKENISPVGKLKGHKLYEFTYKGDDRPQIGVIAQEVEKDRPDAVSKRPDGLRQVDYGKLFNASSRRGKKAA